MVLDFGYGALYGLDERVQIRGLQTQYKEYKQILADTGFTQTKRESRRRRDEREI